MLEKFHIRGGNAWVLKTKFFNYSNEKLKNNSAQKQN